MWQRLKGAGLSLTQIFNHVLWAFPKGRRVRLPNFQLSFTLSTTGSDRMLTGHQDETLSQPIHKTNSEKTRKRGSWIKIDRFPK